MKAFVQADVEQFLQKNYVKAEPGLLGLTLSSIHEEVSKKYTIAVETLHNLIYNVFGLVLTKKTKSKQLLIGLLKVRVTSLFELALDKICSTKDVFYDVFMNRGPDIPSIVPEVIAGTLFDRGISLNYITYNQLGRLLIHTYGPKLRSSQVKETDNQIKQNSESSNHFQQSCPSKFKKGTLSILMSEIKNQTINNTSIALACAPRERENTMKAYKIFLENNNLKKNIWDIKKECNISIHIEKCLSKKLGLLFGSFESFLYHALNTKAGAKVMKNALEQTLKKIGINLQADFDNQLFFEKIRFVEKIQQHFNAQAPLILQLLGISKENYHLLRNILGFEKKNKDNNVSSSLKPSIVKQWMPKFFESHQFTQLVITEVHTKYKSACNPAMKWSYIIRCISQNAEIAHDFGIFLQNNATRFGTFAKRVYLDQLKLEERHWSFIQSKLAKNQSDWKKISEEMVLKKMIPEIHDSDWILKTKFDKEFSTKKRRKKIKIDNISIPSLPTAEKAESLIPTVSEKLSDSDWIQKLSLPKSAKPIYVGRESTLQVPISKGSKRLRNENEVWMREFDMRMQLISIVVDLIEKNLLVSNKHEITLKVVDWQDAAPICGTSFFAAQVGIFFDPEIFPDESHFSEVTRMLPVILGYVGDLTEVVQQMRKIIARGFRSLKEPFAYRGKVFTFVPYIMKADNAMLCRVIGNNSSGYQKCGLCSIPLNMKEKSMLYSYTSTMWQKSLSNILMLYINEKSKMQQYGLKELLVLFPEFEKELGIKGNLEKAYINEYFVGVDNLHNLKGFMKNVLDMERKRKDFNSCLYAQNISQLLHRSFSLELLKGREYRLIFVDYENTILKCVGDKPRRELLRQFLSIFIEVIAIMYALPSAQLIKSIRLRLHVTTFLVRELVKELWGHAASNLYFHMITCHAAICYEKSDYRNMSCEGGESFFSELKPLLQKGNRKQKYALLDAAIALGSKFYNFSDYRHRAYHKKWENKISTLFFHEWKEIRINANLESSAFISDLTQKYGYVLGVDFYLDTTDSISYVFPVTKEIVDYFQK